MTAKYEVRVFNTVEDIGKDSIDAISNDGFFTYGWFKTLEQQTDFPINPLYLALYKNSELMAFAPCFIDKLDHYFAYGPYIFPFMKNLLIMGSKLGLWQKHVLICYSPFCYRSKIMINDSSPKKAIVLLLHKIGEICKKERILFSSFLFVSEFDNDLAKSLKNFGYLTYAWKNTVYIDPHWSNFEEYLASLNYKVRKNVQREIRKFSKSGITIEEASNFSEFSQRIVDLSANLFKKYNPWGQPLFGQSFFRSLSENANDKVKLLVAKKYDKVVGFLLLMRHKDVLDAFTCGFDYDQLSNTDFAYFNLVYYYPIKWAIQEGISKVYYRFSAEKVKLRRGCKQEQIFSNVKPHNTVLDLLVNLYIKLRYSKFTRTMGERLIERNEPI